CSSEGIIIKGEPNIIESVNYPGNYGDTNCDATIEVSSDCKAAITFLVFNIEDTPTQGGVCQFDYFEIFDGAGQNLGRWCGIDTPPDVTSTTNTLRIYHLSDDFYNDGVTGFRIQFSETNCLHTGPLTLVSPPRQEYTEVVHALERTSTDDVSFSVKACSDASFILTSLSDLNDANNVITEVVIGDQGNSQSEIRDEIGGTAAETHSGDLLSCTDFRPFWVAWNDTAVAFGQGETVGENTLLTLSDAREVNHFFISTTDDVIGIWSFDGLLGHLTEREGVFSNPSYNSGDYAQGEFHQWVIETDLGPNERLALTFLHFELVDADENGDCVDFVDVKDSELSEQSKKCGVQSPYTVERESNPGILQVTFSASEDTQAAAGFLAEYHVKYICGQNFTADSGRITSPLYADPYPPYAACEWNIEVTSGYRVALTFVDFKVEKEGQDGTCGYDTVAIYSGATQDPNSLVA
ncbi:hypothetical protein BaRGS_00031757, partial [Batillaria attramentaria]